MKLIHLSDLHLGKRVNEFSMVEDQRYILKQILKIMDEEQPDGVIIAGDVYDKSIPSVEAVELFDMFLGSLADRKLQVFVISGNHDSAERLAFASGLIERSGIHISPVYDGQVSGIEMQDAYGPVKIYLLPFVKPSHVRNVFPQEEIVSYTDAVQVAINHMDVDTGVRNILVTHQFVTGAERSDSEEISVGGSDNVDASVFAAFDYVALGHIHGPQRIGRDTIRYCGTPLKYSFSEARHQKSVTVVELQQKGSVLLRTVELQPRHDMRELRGTYHELTSRENYEGTAVDDYIHITLTDEEDEPDAIAKLRTIYPNLMKLDYDNKRTRAGMVIGEVNETKRCSPIELLQEFYELQNNQPMNEAQVSFASSLIAKIWEG
ncbi:MAG: exonuclease SbcCD subunit D [Eubacteriales bacterium]|nr:exonuclease SbcCD subunit D [Eubacteriales bacterium]